MLKTIKTSPDTGAKRSRVRPIVSCLACRERKLKCDRADPCNQCIRRRVPDQCSFASASDQIPSRVLSNAQTRIPKSERSITPNATQSLRTSLPIDSRTAPSSSYSPRGVQEVDNYLGRTGIPNHFKDIRDFLLVADKKDDPAMRELQTVHKRFKGQNRLTKVKITPERLPQLSDLIENVHNNATVQRSFLFYLEYFETLSPVLDQSKFSKDAQRFWTVSFEQKCSYLGFILLSNLMLALHKFMRPTDFDQQPSATSSSGFYVPLSAEVICDMVDRYLEALQPKIRTSFECLQAHAFLLLVWRVGQRPAAEIWPHVGLLVRFSSLAGLGTLPAGALSEMAERKWRIRVWRTIQEIDLHTSIDCNLPPMILPLTDTNDHTRVEEFRLCTGALAKSLQLRIDAWDTTTRLDIVMHKPENFRLLLQIHRDLVTEYDYLSQHIPVSDLGVGTDMRPDELLARARLHITLLRSRLSYLSAISQVRGIPESQRPRETLLEISLKILYFQDYFDTLDNSQQDNWHLHLLHLFCKGDLLQAALYICRYVRAVRGIGPASDHAAGQEAHIAERPQQPLKQLLRAVEMTLDNMLRIIDKPGGSVKNVMVLSIALQSAKAPNPSADLKEAMQQGLENVLQYCRERITIKHGEKQNETLEAQDTPSTGLDIDDWVWDNDSYGDFLLDGMPGIELEGF